MSASDPLSAGSKTPLVVERVAELRAPPLDLQDQEDTLLLSPDEIAQRLPKLDLSRTTKEDDRQLQVARLSFSDLPESMQILIFSHLNDRARASAAQVCREWHRLNTYPFGELPIRNLRWILHLQRRLPRETLRALCYAQISQEAKPSLLGRVDPEQYLSESPLSLASSRFLRGDPIERPVKHGKDLMLLEFRADPPLRTIVDSIIEAENIHGEAYQAFYHALNTNVHFFSIAVNTLLGVMNQGADLTEEERVLASIHWLRFPQSRDSKFPDTVQQFLAEFPMEKAVKDGGKYDDHHPEIKQWLLAVSPFLFSNFSTAGESTWELFLTNRSVYPPDPKSFFNALCDHFHLLPDKKVRQQFAEEFANKLGEGADLASLFLRKGRSPEQRDIVKGDRGNRDYGVLLQILVPKPLVDKIVYPCGAYGIQGEKYQGAKMSEVFKTICKDPLKWDNITVQGRLLTSPLVTRGNGIKVLTYGHTAFFQSPGGRRFLNELEQLMFRAVWESTKPEESSPSIDE